MRISEPTPEVRPPLAAPPSKWRARIIPGWRIPSAVRNVLRQTRAICADERRSAAAWNVKPIVGYASLDPRRAGERIAGRNRPEETVDPFRNGKMLRTANRVRKADHRTCPTPDHRLRLMRAYIEARPPTLRAWRSSHWDPSIFAQSSRCIAARSWSRNGFAPFLHSNRAGVSNPPITWARRAPTRRPRLRSASMVRTIQRWPTPTRLSPNQRPNHLRRSLGIPDLQSVRSRNRDDGVAWSISGVAAHPRCALSKVTPSATQG